MQIFEMIMLICFGMSWPISVYKSIRSKSTKGKSAVFIIAIIIGYISGIIGKIVNHQLSYVVVLYCINLIVVSIDLGLYFFNAKHEKERQYQKNNDGRRVMRENVRMQVNTMREINEITMKGEIVVFGSTYMAGFPLYELVNQCRFENAVYNRSIEGLTVKEALEIVRECVIEIRPSKIFLALGEEDENDPNVIDEYTVLVSELRSRLPQCRLYLIGLTGTGSYVSRFNKSMRALCDDKTVTYIDFVSKKGSDTALYKARFKQLSCFFRDQSLTMSDAFAMAEL